MAKAWMPLYVADYLADTGHLDCEAHGVYLLAIMHYWQTSKPLPNDKQLLCICRCFDSAKFEEIWSKVSKFFTLTDKGWVHKRIENELEKSENISNKRRLAGSKGGASRVANAIANSEANDKQLPTQSQSQYKNPTTAASLEEVVDNSKAKIIKLIPSVKEIYDIEGAKWVLAREKKPPIDPALDLVKWMQKARTGNGSKKNEPRRISDGTSEFKDL